MTSPVTYNTPSRIIRAGMMNAGKLQEGDEPSSDQLSIYLNRLNDIINVAQTQGLKLWLNLDLAVPLVAGQALYTLGPSGSVNMTKPLRVISAYYIDSNGVIRPLTVLSWDEYTRLSTKSQKGAINSYFVDKQQLSLNVSFWLTPDTQAATGAAHLIIQQQVANLVSLTDAVNFPLEWFMFLHWALADEICTGGPEAIVQRCAQRAAMYRELLEDFDVEDAPTSFQPDNRSQYSTGAFR